MRQLAPPLTGRTTSGGTKGASLTATWVRCGCRYRVAALAPKCRMSRVTIVLTATGKGGAARKNSLQTRPCQVKKAKLVPSGTKGGNLVFQACKWLRTRGFSP